MNKKLLPKDSKYTPNQIEALYALINTSEYKIYEELILKDRMIYLNKTICGHTPLSTDQYNYKLGAYNIIREVINLPEYIIDLYNKTQEKK